MSAFSDLSKSAPISNYSVVFPFEADFDPNQKREWMIEHRNDTFYYAGIYALLIFGIKLYMQSRPRLELRIAVVTWNLLLAAFSIMGLCRTLPELTHVLSKFGFTHSVCDPSFIAQDKVTAFWAWLFILSKVPELGDTLFVVLRKHQLIFLHVYHHITVPLYFWYIYSEHTAPSRWFVVMNFFAHSLMYTYYALRAMSIKMPRYIAMSITTVQIIQLVIGFYVNCFGYVALRKGMFCHLQEYIAICGMFMYGTYLILFVRFFYSAYLAPKTEGKKTPVKFAQTNM